jgi:hypothetical protein
MIHEDTDVIFPPRVIPALENVRGQAWRELVNHVAQQAKEDPDRLAFVLLMTRLCGCASCHADSYRAMRGCTQCAIQSTRRYRDPDEDLLAEFASAEQAIQQYLHS